MIKNKADLLSILENPEKLSKELQENTSSVLDACSSFGVYPDKNYLKSLNNIMIDRFVVEKYDLDMEDIKYYAKIFDYSFCVKNLFKKPLNEEDLDTLLELKAPIPDNSIFSLSLINKHAKYLSDAPYQTQTCLRNSLKYMSLQDFLSIDSVLLQETQLFQENPSYFSDKKYAKAFLNSIKNKRFLSLEDFRYYTFNEKDKSLLLKVLEKIHYFKGDLTYNDCKVLNGFESLISKKDFFSLISDNSLTQFSEEEIINDLDFFQDHYVKQLEKQKYGKFDAIIRANNSEFEKFKLIFNKDFLEKNITDFNEIISFSYIERSRSRNGPEFKSFHLKILYIDLLKDKILSDGFIEKLNSPINFFMDFTSLIREALIDKENTIKDAIDFDVNAIMVPVLKKMLPIIMKNENANVLLNNDKDVLINDDVFKDIKEFLPMLANPNGFSLLIKELRDNIGQNFHKSLKIDSDLIMLSAKDVFSIVSKYEKEVASSYFAAFKKIIKAKTIEASINNSKKDNWMEKTFLSHLSALEMALTKQKLINVVSSGKNQVKNHEDYNILSLNNYKYINTLSHTNYKEKNLISFIYGIDKEMPSVLVKEGIKLSSSLLKKMLENENDDWTVKFLSNYFKNKENEIQLKSDVELVSILMKSKNQNNIYKFNLTKKEQEKTLQDFIRISDEFHKVTTLMEDLTDLLNLSMSKLEKVNKLPENYDPANDINAIDFFISKNKRKRTQKIKVPDETQYLLKYTDDLYNQMSLASTKLSFNFIRETIKEEIKNAKFNLVYNMLNSGLLEQHKDFLDKSLQSLNKEQFNQLVKQDNFIKYIKNNHIPNMIPNGFTDKEKSLLADKLFGIHIDKNNKENEANIEDNIFRKVFSLFNENDRSFIKSYMIEKYPLKMLRNYVFNFVSPSEIKENSILSNIEQRNKDSESIDIERFTGQEVLQLFENIKSKYKTYFVIDDINARMSEFFLKNYTRHYGKGNAEINDYINQSYFKDIELFKEKNPAVYVFSLNHQLIENHYLSDVYCLRASKEEKDNLGLHSIENYSRDMIHNTFLAKRVCYKTFVQGMNDIVGQFPNIKGHHSVDMALSTIDDIFTGLAFEETSYSREKKTLIKYEDLKFLVKNALLINPETVFKSYNLQDDVFQSIARDVSSEFSVDEFKNVLFPREKVVNESYKKDDKTDCKFDRLKCLFENMIKTAVVKNNSELINYIYKEVNFFKSIESLGYSEMYKKIGERQEFNGKSVKFMMGLISDDEFLMKLQKAKLNLNLENMLDNTGVVKKKKI